MKIVVAHNRYRPIAPSGEDAVVDQESTALAALGHEVARFERHSAEIDSWPRARRAALPVTVVWSEGSRRAVTAELVRFAPDVVHVHNVFPLITPSVLHACHALGIPVVATLHNYKLGCANGELFRDGRICHDCPGRSGAAALLHGCYRGSRLLTLPVVTGQRVHAWAWRSLVSAYIFISQSQQEVLRPLGLPADRSFVKHNFVPALDDADAVPPGDAVGENGEGLRPADPTVAYVGRLDAAKGAAFLIRAWDDFLRRRPRSRLRLEIVGSGTLEPQVRRWAADRPSVTVLGHVPRPRAFAALARARAALVPSQWQETFGLVAVEAMAAGTPPVASAHGSFPEIVTDRHDGVLVPPSDPAAWSEVLADVEDHPRRWAGYGARARETYRRRFTSGANVEALLAVYRFAIEHPVARFDLHPGIPGVTRRSPCQQMPRGHDEPPVGR